LNVKSQKISGYNFAAQLLTRSALRWTTLFPPKAKRGFFIFIDKKPSLSLAKERVDKRSDVGVSLLRLGLKNS
jgi:hypothetical protein